MAPAPALSHRGKLLPLRLELVAGVVLMVTMAVPEATPLVMVTGDPEVTEQVGKSEAPLGLVAREQATLTVPE